MSGVDTASAPTAPSRPLEGPADRRRRQRIAVIFGIAALLLLWMRIKTAPGDVVFAPTSPFDEKQLSEIHLPAAQTVTICLVVAVVGTVLQALGLLHGAVRGLVVALVGVAFMVGFLCWVYSGQDLPMTNPLPGTMSYATPLIFGALAGALCERSGVINVAIEGQFLAGAFIASVVGTLTYSPYLGMLGGIGAGVADSGAAGGVRDPLPGQPGHSRCGARGPRRRHHRLPARPDSGQQDAGPQLAADPATPITIPGLAYIPVIGPVLFHADVLVYIMYVSVALVTFIAVPRPDGVCACVRSASTRPPPTRSGINVKRTRYQAVLFGGVFAGLGGAFFTIGSTGAFDKDASAGNGVHRAGGADLGPVDPVGAIAGRTVLRVRVPLQNQLQILADDPERACSRMTPYIATIFAVAGLRRAGPGAGGRR